MTVEEARRVFSMATRSFTPVPPHYPHQLSSTMALQSDGKQIRRGATTPPPASTEIHPPPIEPPLTPKKSIRHSIKNLLHTKADSNSKPVGQDNQATIKKRSSFVRSGVDTVKSMIKPPGWTSIFDQPGSGRPKSTSPMPSGPASTAAPLNTPNLLSVTASTGPASMYAAASAAYVQVEDESEENDQTSLDKSSQEGAGGESDSPGYQDEPKEEDQLSLSTSDQESVGSESDSLDDEESEDSVDQPPAGLNNITRFYYTTLRHAYKLYCQGRSSECGELCFELIYNRAGTPPAVRCELFHILSQVVPYKHSVYYLEQAGELCDQMVDKDLGKRLREKTLAIRNAVEMWAGDTGFKPADEDD